MLSGAMRFELLPDPETYISLATLTAMEVVLGSWGETALSGGGIRVLTAHRGRARYCRGCPVQIAR